MKKLKLLLVPNNLTRWDTWDHKIEALKNWGADADIELDITIKHTKYADVPFIDYNYTSDQYDKGVIMGNNLLGIHPGWYDENVSKLAVGYDIVAFIVPPSQWKGQKAAGWRYDHNLGPIELQTLSTSEFESYRANGKSYLKFLMYLKHELSHAFYEIANQPDRTHEFYYAGDWYSEQAIKAVVWPQPKYASDDPTWWANFLKLLTLIRLWNTAPKEEIKPPELPKENLLEKMCLAIQRHEGWFDGSRSWRNKNPGNLRYVGQAKTIGFDKNNFAIFASYEDGFNALQNMIRNAAKGLSKVYNPEMTLTQFFGTYAPSSDDNDPDNYARVVAKEMGVDTSFKIKNLLA
jgi:hypothetical protein